MITSFPTDRGWIVKRYVATFTGVAVVEPLVPHNAGFKTQIFQLRSTTKFSIKSLVIQGKILIELKFQNIWTFYKFQKSKSGNSKYIIHT